MGTAYVTSKTCWWCNTFQGAWVQGWSSYVEWWELWLHGHIATCLYTVAKKSDTQQLAIGCAIAASHGYYNNYSTHGHKQLPRITMCIYKCLYMYSCNLCHNVVNLMWWSSNLEGLVWSSGSFTTTSRLSIVKTIVITDRCGSTVAPLQGVCKSTQ